MNNSADIFIPQEYPINCFVKNIWRLNTSNYLKKTELILPKGTVELIFNYSDEIVYCNADGKVQKLPFCFINGINTRPFKLTKGKKQSFLGLQLNTIGLKVLFGFPVKEYNDSICEGPVVCKSLEQLTHQLIEKKCFNHQVELILSWIKTQLTRVACYNKAEQLFDMFYSEGMTPAIGSLCKKANITDRQLRRITNDWLGMSTENFMLYKKYLNALNILHNTGKCLTQVGLDAGYFDQSHFIRDFKRFTDLTPGQYRNAYKLMPGHIMV